MKYLLDTHTAIWLAKNSPQLSQTAATAILDVRNTLFVSIISAWEVALKCSLDKLRIDGNVAGFFEIAASNGIAVLPIKKSHLEYVQDLPFLHRDPFDRLLIATSECEDMTLITAEKNIKKYDVKTLW